MHEEENFNIKIYRDWFESTANVPNFKCGIDGPITFRREKNAGTSTGRERSHLLLGIFLFCVLLFNVQNIFPTRLYCIPNLKQYQKGLEHSTDNYYTQIRRTFIY